MKTALLRRADALLHNRTVPLLVLLFCAGVAAALWNIATLSSQLIESQALQNSALYADAIQQARTFYSETVVAKLQNRDDITIDYDHLHQPNTIPLPATFLIELGERIRAGQADVSVRLFSGMPFPFRSDGGPRDPFEEEALAYLSTHPNDRFTRIEPFQNRRSFRYTQADIMGQSCVDCHNRHPQSPKTDWQVGDVRGVLEITVPIDQFANQTRAGLQNTFFTLGGLFALGGFGIVLVVNRLKRTSQELEMRVLERTADLHHSNQRLSEEQAKSEQLLLNILPEPIADRLKRGEKDISEGFSGVSILFADIVDFTPLSETVPPAELVEILNLVFSAFDRLSEQHGLEKIKTIGDAYMVVGGLPDPRPDHAEAIAEMALSMQATMDQLSRKIDQPLAIRIGINSGPVVAGVIGTKKFIYDLWGDTVNVASRMEAMGISGGIQVAQPTYDLLRDKYCFEDRGEIEIKGKGHMHAYLLKGRCLAPAPA
ncbi:adenylate/guanylate cyclase domain-containing protein [Leptolyngbya sp. PCC 6406]|uniref:adenylate/guanylate cyclase domain-containing protein n=1 Tax=Leptolyngbya sp. PCC 6406 TaxID=1173264 RepID=UPI0002AD1366|nr:adenylate/guanylate cyclase domain-containing protein [Leptolyngbya sp. PCC 6406]